MVTYRESRGFQSDSQCWVPRANRLDHATPSPPSNPSAGSTPAGTGARRNRWDDTADATPTPAAGAGARRNRFDADADATPTPATNRRNRWDDADAAQGGEGRGEAIGYTYRYIVRVSKLLGCQSCCARNEPEMPRGIL